RPLLTLEKNDIVKMAKKMETYETSILPFEDCCTIFKPKAPKTKPSFELVKKFEDVVDFEPMIEKAMENIEVYMPSKKEKIEDDFSDLLEGVLPREIDFRGFFI